jgi:DNA-binding transcriptional LysR family regulator
MAEKRLALIIDLDRCIGCCGCEVACKQENGVAVDVACEFDNIENIKRAVEIGAGAAILPLPTVRREVEAGFLIGIPFEGVRFTRPLGIIHKRHKHLSVAAERFIDLLCEELAAGSSPNKPASLEAALTA